MQSAPASLDCRAISLATPRSPRWLSQPSAMMYTGASSPILRPAIENDGDIVPLIETGFAPGSVRFRFANDPGHGQRHDKPPLETLLAQLWDQFFRDVPGKQHSIFRLVLKQDRFFDYGD